MRTKIFSVDLAALDTYRDQRLRPIACYYFELADILATNSINVSVIACLTNNGTREDLKKLVMDVLMLLALLVLRVSA